MELLEEILSDENLDKAIQQVVKSKGSNGVDKMSTMDLKNVMTGGYREQLKEEIRTRTYKPKPVKRVEIIKDGDVISLIRKYLQSGVMINEEYKESVIGTPQGGNLSPLLGNIILDKLDKELESRGLPFVRYADDCLIFVGTEKAANRVMKNVTHFLEEELRLKVNVTKSKVRRPEDTNYLGFNFYKEKQLYLYKAKPSRQTIQRLREKIKTITSRSNAMSMDEKLTRLKYLFRGWFNYYKISSIKKLCNRTDGYTRFRLRICIGKQWKKTKTKYNALKKLGIDKYKAWEWANTRKGYTRVASSFIMCRAVPNKLLEKRGFLPMETLYQNNFI